jgi:PKD repeat protein
VRSPGRAWSLLAGAVLAGAGGLLAPLPAIAAAPTPPFTQCPAIGLDKSCGLLITINPDGTTSIAGDPTQPPFDGIEDTLVGVVNNSSLTVQIIPISSSSTIPIFAFDGDGICSGFYNGTPAGCPFGPTGYEGPNTSFSISDGNTGTVNFPAGLAPGKSTYFSLEGAPSAGSIVVPRYVALGDSYQSGEGVPPFIAGTDQSNNLCHRSMGAYAELITGRTNVPPGVEFWACSGATIPNFYNGEWNEPAQIGQLAGKPATLVTLGVGGNDIGFDRIATTCTDISVPLFGQQNKDYHSPCGDYLATTLKPDTLINGLSTGNVNPGDGKTYSLPALYGDIRKNASVARVYVIGYPNPLPLPTAVSSDCQADVLHEDGSHVGFGPYNAQFTIHKADVQWMEKILAHLNSTIQLNALDAGFYFVDNSLTLKDHDICGNDKTHWLHGVVLKNNQGTPSEWSFHPNGAGQTAIANVVASGIAGPSVGGFRSTVFPGGFVQQFLPVGNGQLQLIVETAWPGSDVQLSLISPSNVVYGRNTQAPGVIHRLQSNGETLAITNPQAGQWTVQLYGANVPPQGESVRVDVTQIAQSAFAPVAAITASTDRGVAPASAQFNGSASRAYNGAAVASYKWDFGDGSAQASGAVQTHSFATAGSYTVTLTVTDSNGQTDSATRPMFVTATDQPPTASFASGPTNPSAPTQLTFDASASSDVDGQISSYAWNFGDGSTGIGVTPAHTYAGAGTYNVILKVTDDGGLTASLCQTATTGQFSTPGVFQKCNLIITASDATMTYGDAPPAITPIYSGFVNGDTPASLTVQPTCATTVTAATAPGVYPGATSCSGAVDPAYKIIYRSGTVTVSKRGATLGYTGGLFFSTGSSSSTTASVTLQGVLTPAPGGSPDLTKAAPVFNLYKSTNQAMTMPDVTCSATVSATGVVTCTLPALGVDNWTVILQLPASDAYFKPAAADPVVVTVYQPTTGIFATGGGWVTDPGFQNKPVPISPQNNHGNFGFNVRYKSGTTRPQGQAVYVFRGADGNDYIVKSNSWQGGGAAFTTTTASFSGKANVTVIDPSTGLQVAGLGGGNFTFRIDVTSGETPTFAISVYDPSGALYHQAGTTSSQLPLGGGNIVVHQ